MALPLPPERTANGAQLPAALKASDPGLPLKHIGELILVFEIDPNGIDFSLRAIREVAQSAVFDPPHEKTNAAAPGSKQLPLPNGRWMRPDT